MRVFGTLTMILVTLLFCLNVGTLPDIGDPNSAPNSHVTPLYIEEGTKDTGSPNLVTAVLADYRGFDTLGETTVMFVAGMTAVMLLKKPKTRKNRGESKGGDRK